MQSWSDEGGTLLVSAEKTDKFDSSTLAVDCSDEEFSRGVTPPSIAQNDTANEPLGLVQQTRGQKGSEA